MNKIMTVKELLEKTQLMLNQRTIYVNGCFGAPLNYGDNLKRYTTNYDYNIRNAATIKAAAQKAKEDRVPIFGGDCHCSFKGIAWGWNADPNKAYGGASYASNGLPDCTINTHRDKYCEPYSTDFSNIVPGEALFYDKEGSHFGLYIGDGLVAENTPKFKNCFQITELWNVKKTMSNGRKWWAHAKMLWVDYSEQPEPPKPEPEKKKITCPCCGKVIYNDGTKVEDELKVGDMVTMAEGAPVYNSTRKYQSWVYKAKLYVRQINGDRIVVSTLKTGDVTGPVDRKYLTKI